MSTPGISIDGTNGSDLLHGTGGDDSIGGFGSHDEITDGRGNDFVWAGSGDDFIYVGMGNDFFDGGEGVDRISFLYLDYSFTGNISEDNPYGVTFDLTKTTQDMGIMGIDTFVRFEDIEGSYGNDVLLGNGGANRIDGIAGNDILVGRAGTTLSMATTGMTA
jgi:Ca2+-binding RTX toxin-like protein